MKIGLMKIGHFAKADPEYGRRVAEGLGLKIDELALAIK
jgi:catalase